MGWTDDEDNKNTAKFTSSGTKTLAMEEANVTLFAVWQSETAGKEASSKNRTLANFTTGYSYKNPVIPQGFKAVNEGSATWEYTDSTTVSGWNEGLVIQDASNGNQFVWVPCTTGSLSDVVTYKKDFSLNSGDTITSASDDTSVYPVASEDAQINSYGGFYVARFEAGIPSSGTAMSASTNNVTTYTPVSKAGSKVWNYINYTNAATVSKKMVNNTSTYGNNKSGLITGKQWDTIMAWYKKAGIGVETSTQNWGSYYNLAYTITPGYWFDSISNTTTWIQNTNNVSHTASSGRYYHGSGKNASGIKKNIADIGGNFWEWTAEINTGGRITRSGSSSRETSNNPASHRVCYADATDQTFSFRCVIFVQ